MGEFFDRHVASPVMRLRLFGALQASAVGGENVLPRGRKAQAILCYLALSPEGAVPRRRLVELLWSGRWEQQGRASLRQSLIELRAAIDCTGPGLFEIDRDFIAVDHSRIWIDGFSRRDDAAAPGDAQFAVEQLMETLLGLDPRFDEWIRGVRTRVEARQTTRRHAPPLPPGASPAAPERPRRLLVSVCPILEIGTAPADDLIAPALTQELVTALARFRWLGVRFSTQVHEGDYRVEGYLSREGEGLRLVLRLIDERERDIIVWTGTTRTALPLHPAAIGELVEKVIEQIDPEILAIETRKALYAPTGSRDSYACVLRAIALLYRFEEGAWREALQLLDQARQLDPQNARAFAIAAMCRITGIAQGWSDDAARDLRMADLEAERATGCDPHDSLGLALLGHIRAFVHHDFARALDLFRRAISANPSCGFAWGYSAVTHAYVGQIAAARERLDRARAILVHDPFLSFFDSFGAVICFFARDWEGTVATSRQQLALRPRFTNMRKLLIGALCFLSRFDEARREDRQLREDEPDFTWPRHLRAYPFHHDADRSALEAALSRAGLIDAPARGAGHHPPIHPRDPALGHIARPAAAQQETRR